MLGTRLSQTLEAIWTIDKVKTPKIQDANIETNKKKEIQDSIISKINL